MTAWNRHVVDLAWEEATLLGSERYVLELFPCRAQLTFALFPCEGSSLASAWLKLLHVPTCFKWPF